MLTARARLVLGALMLALPATALWAEAPRQSLRPQPRPAATAAPVAQAAPKAAPVAQSAQAAPKAEAAPVAQAAAAPVAQAETAPAAPVSQAAAKGEAVPVPQAAPKAEVAQADAAPRDAAVASLSYTSAVPGVIGPQGFPHSAVGTFDLPPGLVAFAPDAALVTPRPGPRATAPQAPDFAANASLPPLRPLARTAEIPAAAQPAPAPEAATAALRPRMRPTSVTLTAAVAAVAPSVPAPALLRPKARPAGFAPRAATAAAITPAPATRARPTVPVQPVAAIRPGTEAITGARGQVCGVPGIQGQAIAPIIGRVNGCGVANPVKITAVAGVRLSQAATMDCDTARALHSWVERGLKPAFGATGGGVAALQVAGHYVCRTRNHRKGARLSEHSKGKAIDIAAIVLANGKSLSILRDWRGPEGKKMKAAHRAACGIFGTTLGPGSDGMHEDHLHFDTARHRNGAYCR